MKKLLLILLATLFFFTSCEQPTENEPPVEVETPAYVGTWLLDLGDSQFLTFTFTTTAYNFFFPDNSGEKGYITVIGDQLIAVGTHINDGTDWTAYTSEEVLDATVTYTWKVDGNQLTLTEDGSSPNNFTRQ